MLRIFLFLAALLPLTAQGEPVRVVVSVPPQKSFVEKVGGSHVEVQAMVRPGHSPHTYDPTPKQISALAQADLYVRIGVPFEDAWMRRFTAVNPDMKVLDARSGIDLSRIEQHAHEGEREQDGAHSGAHQSDSDRDPHLWTSPPLVKQMASSIRDVLTGLDPANREDYARNYDTFAAELDSLDTEIRTLLAGTLNRSFLVYHPAWGYFADTYGLIQIPIEKEGKEPGARALTALIEQAKRESIRIVFVQPQLDKRFAAQVAKAIGGRVVAIDPLAEDYAGNLRRVARLIAESGKP